MYDPIAGRFLEEDPIGLAGHDLNFYRYVHNNPLNRVDPTGLDDVEEEVLAIRRGSLIAHDVLGQASAKSALEAAYIDAEADVLLQNELLRAIAEVEARIAAGIEAILELFAPL